MKRQSVEFGPPDGHNSTHGSGPVVVASLGGTIATVRSAADEIHPAARVRKTHSTGTGTFVSVDGGPLGYLVEGAPRIVNPRTARHTLPAVAGQVGSPDRWPWG